MTATATATPARPRGLTSSELASRLGMPPRQAHAVAVARGVDFRGHRYREADVEQLVHQLRAEETFPLGRLDWIPAAQVLAKTRPEERLAAFRVLLAYGVRTRGEDLPAGDDLLFMPDGVDLCVFDLARLVNYAPENGRGGDYNRAVAVAAAAAARRLVVATQSDWIDVEDAAVRLGVNADVALGLAERRGLAVQRLTLRRVDVEALAEQLRAERDLEVTASDWIALDAAISPAEWTPRARILAEWKGLGVRFGTKTVEDVVLLHSAVPELNKVGRTTRTIPAATVLGFDLHRLTSHPTGRPEGYYAKFMAAARRAEVAALEAALA